MSERHEFKVSGFVIKTTVGGNIDDELLDEAALAELGDVVNFAVAWTQKHGRGLRIPKIPAPPRYEEPPPRPGELWRTIPGFEGTHEASNQYRIRSVDRLVESASPWGHVMGGPKIRRPVHGRILTNRVRGQLAYVTLTVDGQQRAYKVKDLVCAAWPELADNPR